MNVFSDRMIAHLFLAAFRGALRGDSVERRTQLGRLTLGENSGCVKCRRMCLAGGYFIVE
jgi:hypothetical protein